MVTRNYTISSADMGYIELAAAILRQAYIDYVDVLLGRPPYRCKYTDSAEVRDIESFLDSDWAAFLSFGHNEELRDRAIKTAVSLKEPKKRYTHIKTYYHIRNAGDER